ncbi:MAG: hypothetical protein RIS47_852 [Bacteroidota bacterium]|jgi:hypothetical protein
MKTLRYLFSIILFVAIYNQGFAQLGEVNYDSRIKTQLDELGLKYTITDSGNFKLGFDIENNRTQTVVIRSKTYTYEGMEIREINATAQVAKDKFEFKITNLFDLLERNQTYKVGAWQIHGGESPYVLEFALKISAEAKSDALDKFVRLAAKISDAVELEITGADEY